MTFYSQLASSILFILLNFAFKKENAWIDTLFKQTAQGDLMENYFIIFQYFAMVCCLFFMGLFVLIIYFVILDEIPTPADGEISYLPALYVTLIYLFFAMMFIIQKLFRPTDDCWFKSRAL